MKEQDYIKAFQLTLDEIIESKFDMSIDWTARYKECIEKAVDIRFKEFIKNIHKKQNKQNNEQHLHNNSQED